MNAQLEAEGAKAAKGSSKAVERGEGQSPKDGGLEIAQRGHLSGIYENMTSKRLSRAHSLGKSAPGPERELKKRFFCCDR